MQLFRGSVARYSAVLCGCILLSAQLYYAAEKKSDKDSAKQTLTPAVVDYPEAGSLFPPDIAPPLFYWRDENHEARVWQVEAVFEERHAPLRFRSEGERAKVGEVDNTLVGFVPPELSPKQSAAHTWRPTAEAWKTIKQYSVKKPVTVRFTGYSDDEMKHAVSRAEVSFSTSRDPVNATLFFRDVPLIPPQPEQIERGVIKPLPDSLLPKVKWRVRDIGQLQSRTVMENLPTCANCHSVSADGKTLGIDVDGPQNDKALYAMVPIEKVSRISNDRVIRWSSFTEKASPKRFGFMSQVSPDGKYVITSVDPPGLKNRVADRMYQGSYSQYAFGQVFYPTRGLLAWYSKETGKLTKLPGADDPEYVHVGAFWSPDGKFVIFSRAKAHDPYPPDQKPSRYANDPRENQTQYDLYRIEFNDGKGGVPVPLEGASNNGLSNNFPKVSPDGKWVVFVQNRNGLLMRPDSKLYIVPSTGGTPRPLRSNLPSMNSWHSFSPNGRWLVFSSKSPTPYTQLYLTHIDADGNSTPAILVENATASNRAANIPEFINVAPDLMEKIEAPATDFYRAFNIAADLEEKRRYQEAADAWREAMKLVSDDPRALNNFGLALSKLGRYDEAVAQYRRSLEIAPDISQTHNNLGAALAAQGHGDQAISLFEKALELDPENAKAHANFGAALAELGRLREAVEQLRAAAEADPRSSEVHNNLGAALARSGNLNEAAVHAEKAVELEPDSVGYRYNLGRIYAALGRFGQAAMELEQAAKLTNGSEPAILDMLAAMYAETGRMKAAVEVARRALDLAARKGDRQLADSLRQSLAQYTQAAGASR